MSQGVRSAGTGRTRTALKEWTMRLILMMGSLAFALAVVEVVLRLFFPLYGGRDNLTLDGKSIKSFLDPGTVYRQYSNEYNALTTITAEGYRAPAAAGNPDVLFVGDSFTFGFGLADDETFASIYCKQQRLQCANLGMPGSGTLRQVRRLEQFLTDRQWRPKQVKLFFFGMSRSFSAGNDFADNYTFGRWLQQQAATRRGSSAATAPDAMPAEQPRNTARQSRFGEWVVSLQKPLLSNVHLVRHLKYHWGPLLKTMVLAEPDEKRRAEAFNYTARAFEELDALAARNGFEYEIFLVVPVQDIIMGTDDETLATLNRIVRKPAVSTANLFRETTGRYYFAYDGHLNVEGARRVAEFLIRREDAQARR